MNPNLGDLAGRLAAARRVLAGLDDTGASAYPSMFDADVISFAHGEGMRRPHPSAIAAGIRALLDTEESSLDNYLFLQRPAALEALVAENFKQRGVRQDVAENVYIDSGTTRVFLAFLSVVAEPGDVFLTPPAFYHPLAGWCEAARVRLVCVPTQASNEYRLSVDDLSALYEGEGWNRPGRVPPRGLFLFNPTMTGSIYSASEIVSLGAFVAEHELVVLEDAIFDGTEFPGVGSAAHLAALPDVQDAVVTAGGCSKADNLANVRVGWACGPAALIDRMRSYATSTSATMPRVVQIMGLAALEAPSAFRDAQIRECAARASLIGALVEELDSCLAQSLGGTDLVRVEHLPRAGHSILLTLDGLAKASPRWLPPIKNSLGVARLFQERCRVAVSPGFSAGFDGCQVRLSFACVGANRTYEDTRGSEVLAALETLAAYIPGTIGRRKVAELADLLRSDVRSVYPDIPPGWQAGRALIAEGFSRLKSGLTEPTSEGATILEKRAPVLA